jgi:hypothetical protein
MLKENLCHITLEPTTQAGNYYNLTSKRKFFESSLPIVLDTQYINFNQLLEAKASFPTPYTVIPVGKEKIGDSIYITTQAESKGYLLFLSSDAQELASIFFPHYIAFKLGLVENQMAWIESVKSQTTIIMKRLDRAKNSEPIHFTNFAQILKDSSPTNFHHQVTEIIQKHTQLPKIDIFNAFEYILYNSLINNTNLSIYDFHLQYIKGNTWKLNNMGILYFNVSYNSLINPLLINSKADLEELRSIYNISDKVLKIYQSKYKKCQSFMKDVLSKSGLDVDIQARIIEGYQERYDSLLI